MSYSIGTVLVGGFAYVIGWENPVEIIFGQVAFVVFACGLESIRAWLTARREEREIADKTTWVLDLKPGRDFHRSLH